MRNLIQWQWESYINFHGSKKNLLIHIFAVPIFLMANTALIVGLLTINLALCLMAILMMALSLAAQAKGHGTEKMPSIPFNGAANAAMRLLIEQWINFPRFVLSGRWWKAWRNVE